MASETPQLSVEGKRVKVTELFRAVRPSRCVCFLSTVQNSSGVGPISPSCCSHAAAAPMATDMWDTSVGEPDPREGSSESHAARTSSSHGLGAPMRYTPLAICLTEPPEERQNILLYAQPLHLGGGKQALLASRDAVKPLYHLNFLHA